MSNDFFDTGDFTAMTRNTRALAEAVMAALAAVEAGFDLLPAKLSIQQGKAHFVASDTGAANAYVVSMAKTPPAYSDGMMIAFRAAANNTGASTINVDSLGVKDIRDYSGGALTAGAILAGALIAVWYDSTNGYFRLLGTSTSISVTQFDIDGLTAETAPADADAVPIQDASASAKRKVTLPNFLIDGWTAETAPADADTTLIKDASEGALNKMTLGNLLLNGWSALTSAADGDLVLMADASDSNALKKMTLANLLISAWRTETATASGDIFLMYDASAGTLAQITKSNLKLIEQGTTEIPLPASAWRAPATNGGAYDNTETGTNDIPIEGWLLDAATEEAIWTSVRLPKSVDESQTISFAVQWTAASGTGTFIAKLAIVALGDNEALDTAVGTAQTCTDTLQTTGNLHLSPTSSGVTPGNTWAEGDMLFVKLSRDVANDTLNADAKVTHVSMYITTNAATDA